ncbi:hypothetical protein APX70_200507 [Pseudomonas syringae pv. maculicola]|uniref:Uncharacterized protein n=1 Tax=Pseudomonas syringae pv. maculicola TaxID=59511 RepID=A0A3M2Y8B1_PSEYM|nr:hypothetical protein APX70_200507 [Pseudomonas syringae pv. maculicola]
MHGGSIDIGQLFLRAKPVNLKLIFGFFSNRHFDNAPTLLLAAG